MTDSLKTTVKLIGDVFVGSAWPTAWLIVTVGAVLSMTIVLFAPNEPAAPGAGSVRTALFDAVSRIVPPLRASDAVET